ncbi:unnamed protein product [Enterobius vermicularis]|uniref:SORBS2 n=1 Tax=Enterobius vermicularis TaxID=51028 RepID=A0A0N4UWM8_ENTVE|nr:unnamed protein product [Enterobius vermicularis]
MSSQQEQSYTPSSTLTSQGSVSNYTAQQISVPGSPGLSTANQSLYSNSGTTRHTHRNNSSTCGNIGEESASGDLYGTLTDRDSRMVSSRQWQLRVVPSNHRNKVGSGSGREDSANYSLTSSNESAENHRNVDPSLPSIEYATSVV